MKKIRLLIVSAFLILCIVVVTPFLLQAQEPTDTHELQLQRQSLQAIISESILLIDQKDKQTPQYFHNHLQDLKKTIEDDTKDLENKPSEPEVAKKRTHLITHFKQTASKLEVLSQSFTYETFLKKVRADLVKLKKEI